ncbi:MAG: nucleotidyltransferase domain-containing protein [Oscillospiraceae bacterium]|nr:nucleotidyltransferase domain-containing protein [Oscillospiraceae bacterium]
MCTQIQDELDAIKESILQAVPAETIYLFGSHAYGTPSDESDLDIYVVVPDDTEDIPELHGDIRCLLWGKKAKELDLLIGRSSVFNRRKNGPTIERVIAEKGTVLYGA